MPAPLPTRQVEWTGHKRGSRRQKVMGKAIRAVFSPRMAFQDNRKPAIYCRVNVAFLVRVLHINTESGDVQTLEK
ncbi:hypothetical protein NDU88_005567 [Pleurodeles waltl]|uniref:Uncharacterized protein n=1 Tax=Pleurodeles waltl TaxID=8319 RepID=A0AAV7MAW7_PLEWA|nr:hypothetical protein NDU88_005567 [Pleurodeles waltl]